MKLVINKCYGGFSLSRAAVKRLAELQGRECYFFKQKLGTDAYEPYEERNRRGLFWVAFDVPNPNEVLGTRDWHEMTLDERKTQNALYSKHALDMRPDDRSDPFLVQVVEELGEAANGAHAELEIVEIPNGVEWSIEKYDGIEHIAERHRTWP